MGLSGPGLRGPGRRGEERLDRQGEALLVVEEERRFASVRHGETICLDNFRHLLFTFRTYGRITICTVVEGVETTI